MTPNIHQTAFGAGSRISMQFSNTFIAQCFQELFIQGNFLIWISPYFLGASVIINWWKFVHISEEFSEGEKSRLRAKLDGVTKQVKQQLSEP